MATSRLPHQDTAWNFSCRRTKFPFGWKQPVAKQDLHPQALPQQHHAFSNTAQIPPELGTPVSVASGRHDRLRDFLWRMPTETGQDKLICAPSAPKAARWWTRPSHRRALFLWTALLKEAQKEAMPVRVSMLERQNISSHRGLAWEIKYYGAGAVPA